jgi:hypothetical protein
MSVTIERELEAIIERLLILRADAARLPHQSPELRTGEADAAKAEPALSTNVVDNPSPSS